jgi:haloacetate dehalogenase
MTPRWSKRRVGQALVALIKALGHERFALAEHDRSARAGYRLVLDHPGSVARFAALAVVPTLDARRSTLDARRSTHYTVSTTTLPGRTTTGS